MGRPPSNGGPSFRFNNIEVTEMESILHAHNCVVPGREVLEALAEKFSGTAERSGKMEVSAKQVWNWFQNRRYAIRAKTCRPYVSGQVTAAPVAQADHGVARNIPQPAPLPAMKSTSQAPHTLPLAAVKSTSQAPHALPASSVQSAGKNGSDNPQMEFEAKSARDGAWYDVASFLSHRALEKADPEAQVRFAGFGPEEDEWVDIRKHVRQRSLPCESSECVAVCPGDLILCFQEGKEQALYFDAHVLDAQRRRHDVRGCRCRFLVRYDHDQSEEIVPLKKICRRPETDYRLQQLQDTINITSQKSVTDGNALKLSAKSEALQKKDKPQENVSAVTISTNVPIAKDSNTPAKIEAESATNTPMETASDAGGSTIDTPMQTESDAGGSTIDTPMQIESDAGGSTIDTPMQTEGETSDATNPTETVTDTNEPVASNSDAGAPSVPVTSNNVPVESES